MGKNFASREVCNLIIEDASTGKPVLHCDYANTTSMEMTSESVFAYGGWNRPKRVAFNGQREATFTVETQMRSFELYALITGAAIESNATFVKREVLTGAASTGALTTTLTPVAGSVFVFADGDDCGEALGVTVSGKNITNASGSSGLVAGNKYIVYYNTEYTEKVQRLNLTSTTFPKDVKIYGETYMKTEDGELLPYKLLIYKASPQANITLDNSNEGDPTSLTIVFDVTADGDNNMMDLIMFEDENEKNY